jgi:hypothetical protein
MRAPAKALECSPTPSVLRTDSVTDASFPIDDVDSDMFLMI